MLINSYCNHYPPPRAWRLIAAFPNAMPKSRIKIMPGNMYRARFKGEIAAEFLPPARPRKSQKLIILCDGMPSIPRKQSLSEFLAAKGFWVIYPRYRGAWESGGQFLEKSPHVDILDIIDTLPTEIEEIAFGQRFQLSPSEIFVIGGSFGGSAAILASLHPRVKE
jgi:predicted alpha/beta hydrolase